MTWEEAGNIALVESAVAPVIGGVCWIALSALFIRSKMFWKRDEEVGKRLTALETGALLQAQSSQPVVAALGEIKDMLQGFIETQQDLQTRVTVLERTRPKR